jgi:GGDEF domain-containing protein
MNSLIHVRDTHILIRKYQAAQNELEIKATFDSLSGLYNRSNFISETDRVLFECNSCERFIALCILDIDQFKAINDTYGHQAGDAAIQITAQKADEILHVIHLEEDCCCEGSSETDCSRNIAGRLGGDEFIFLIMTEDGKDSVINLMKNLLNELNHASADPLKSLEASIGITSVSEIPSSFDILYSQADAALYLAKKSGRNQICVYHEGLS